MSWTASTGLIGHVVEGVPRIWRRPDRPHLPGLADIDGQRLDTPQVAVIPMALGQDDTILRAVGDHVDGLVVGGFGVGHVPAACVDALGDLAARIPVVLTTRTGSGSTAVATYAFRGSESDLLSAGLIGGGYLSPYKARVLLQVLLAAESDQAAVRSIFARLGSFGGGPWSTSAVGRPPLSEDHLHARS